MSLFTHPRGVMRVCHPRIVIHLRRVGDTNLVFFSAMVGEGELPLSQGIHALEQTVVDALAFGKACQVVNIFCHFYGTIRNRRIQVADSQVKTETGRVGKQKLGCQYPVYIAGSFFH